MSDKTRMVIEVDSKDLEDLKRGCVNADVLKNAIPFENFDDCISRDQVASEFADWYGYGYAQNPFYNRIKKIKPVLPQIPKDATIGHIIEKAFPRTEMGLMIKSAPSVDLYIDGIMVARIDRNIWNSKYWR